MPGLLALLSTSIAPPHVAATVTTALGTGLLALAASCGQTPAAVAPPPEFDAERAWNHLEAQVKLGPRPSGSAAAEATRAYFEAELRSYGLAPYREEFEAETPVGPLKMANVVVELPARKAPQSAPIVVLCAHFDTKRASFEFVGANDGASGTAVLLELARLLAQRESPVTYRLVFLDGEEATRWNWRDPDNRYGSRHHVELLRKQPELLERVKACVLLDLVGDADLKLTTDINSDRTLQELFFSAARAGGLGQHVDGQRIQVKDDHLSFMAAGVPSVDLIDLDYEHWHKPTDTLDKVSRESLGAIGRIVLLGLPALEELVR